MFKKVAVGFMLSFLCFVQMSCCSINSFKTKSQIDVEYINAKLNYSMPSKARNQNFVFLSKYIMTKNNNDFTEICYEGKHKHDECFETLAPVNSASGYIFKVNRNTDDLYALTAAHWCIELTKSELYDSTEIIFDDMPIIGLFASFMGKKYRISRYIVDMTSDLCIVKFNSPHSKYAKNAKIAKRDPKIGEEVHMISAPMWSYQKEFRQHYTGKASGCDDYECAFSIPATYGSSGSAVINEKGEIISIISRAAVDFSNYALGAKPASIRRITEVGL